MSRYTYFSVFFIIVGLSLFSSHVVYNEYKDSQVSAAKSLISSQAEHNARVFESWLVSRQSEMRLIARHEATKLIDQSEILKLLVNTAELNGHYDTIFFVDSTGRGVVGVDYKNGQSRIMPIDEVKDFRVNDRDWFKSVAEGKDTFSEPLISRATSVRVSTVSVPIYHENRFIGTIRGAVNLSEMLTFVENIYKEKTSEIYLIDQAGHFVTKPNELLLDQLQSKSEIVEHLRSKDSWIGIYANDLGRDVIGTVVKVPFLGWGLVYEVDKLVALEDVYKTYKDIIKMAGLGLLFAIMVFSVIIKDPIATIRPSDETKSRLASTDDLAEEVLDKLSVNHQQLEKSFKLTDEISARVNMDSLVLEQQLKEPISLNSIALKNVLTDLKDIDSKLNKTQSETKGLILEQSWLIEKLNKIIRKV